MAADCIERIPASNEIKEHLAQTYREARLLKSLLRIAERREKLTARDSRKEGQTDDG